jgi:hypothetical protein
MQRRLIHRVRRRGNYYIESGFLCVSYLRDKKTDGREEREEGSSA